MAERTGNGHRVIFPRSRTFGNAAVSARQRFAWIWSRESLLRLILSFVLATALWLYITSKQNPDVAYTYSQPLSISPANVPDALTVTNNLPAVHVRIRVDNQDVLVTPASFHTYVDLAGQTPGVHWLPVQVVAVDPGIHIAQVSPGRVAVAIEPVREAHIPVRWRLLHHPPRGYSAGNVRVDPSTVTVRGPLSIVSQVAQATVYIDLSQARSSLTGPYPPSLENSQGQPVAGASHLSLTPNTVEVDAPVTALSGYKTLPVLVPLRGQPRPDVGVAALTVQPAEITAYGPVSTLGRITSVHTAPLSVSKHGPGTLTTRLAIELPHGLQSRTRTATITVKLSPVTSSSSVELGVSPINLGFGLVVRTRPASILVTVAGSSSAIARAARHMRAVINLYGYGAGTFQLVPQIQAPSGLHVEGFYPGSVTIVIAPAT